MQKFTNNAGAVLTTAITSSSTSFSVTPALADKFPVVSGTDFFKVTIEDQAGNFEIVKVGTRALGSNVFSNVTRAQDGTTARAFVVGNLVELRMLAADFEATMNRSSDAIVSGANTIRIVNNAFEFVVNGVIVARVASDGTLKTKGDLQASQTSV